MPDRRWLHRRRWNVRVARPTAGARGSQVLPHRSLVERASGWLGRYRRLAHDYVHTNAAGEAMTCLAGIHRTLKVAAE